VSNRLNKARYKRLKDNGTAQEQQALEQQGLTKNNSGTTQGNKRNNKAMEQWSSGGSRTARCFSSQGTMEQQGLS
jgi:hypothetical protein